MTSTSFAVGDHVTFRNLIYRQDLNGAWGVVTAINDRVGLLTEGGERVSAKSENLMPCFPRTGNDGVTGMLLLPDGGVIVHKSVRDPDTVLTEGVLAQIAARRKRLPSLDQVPLVALINVPGGYAETPRMRQMLDQLEAKGINIDPLHIPSVPPPTTVAMERFLPRLLRELDEAEGDEAEARRAIASLVQPPPPESRLQKGQVAIAIVEKKAGGMLPVALQLPTRKAMFQALKPLVPDATRITYFTECTTPDDTGGVKTIFLLESMSRYGTQTDMYNVEVRDGVECAASTPYVEEYVPRGLDAEATKDVRLVEHIDDLFLGVW